MRARTAGIALALLAVTSSCSPVGSEAGSGTSTPARTGGSPSSPTASRAPRTPSGRASSSTRAAPLAGVLIVIDPGHNGGNSSHLSRIQRQVNAGGFRKPCNTTGTATNAGYPEHAFAFNVAKKLRKRLRRRGASVVLTRRSDHGVGPCVNKRGQVAANHEADLLLSIHGDGAAPSAHGFTVLRPARVRGYTVHTFKRSGRLAHAVAHAMARHGFDRATYLGRAGIDERGDLGTLNRAETPAVMVEVGNMRNPADARLMSRTRGRTRIARALAAGIVRYVHQD
ncbi:MAG: N-acetylmuramoyl-L-alanine amidase [Streptosporangiales bacterium]